jgi:hypothetical protein
LQDRVWIFYDFSDHSSVNFCTHANRSKKAGLSTQLRFAQDDKLFQ